MQTKILWERILYRMPQAGSIKYGQIYLSTPADTAKHINKGACQRRTDVSNLVATNKPLKGVLMLMEYVVLRQVPRRS